MPKTIFSNFNRLVVIETNKTSWHSVCQVKVDKIRCCVSNYYYSSISPDYNEYFHVTSFEVGLMKKKQFMDYLITDFKIL